jgi:hypothetical protein
MKPYTVPAMPSLVRMETRKIEELLDFMVAKERNKINRLMYMSAPLFLPHTPTTVL